MRRATNRKGGVPRWRGTATERNGPGSAAHHFASLVLRRARDMCADLRMSARRGANEAIMAVSIPVTADAPAQSGAAIVATDIPARLDRLRWGRFHTLVVVALGITWILDGLEVTLAGAISPALKESPQLKFSNADVGLGSSAYLAGAVLGALFFGWLTDRLGRKRLFFLSPAAYLVATAATALSWNLASFALFRFFTGAGIGGEYTALNSALPELVPARHRGWADLVLHGSVCVGPPVRAARSLLVPG